MFNEHKLKFLHHVTELTDYAKQLGINLKYGQDFAAFRDTLECQPLRHPINPAFDPDRCSLSDESGFWIIGYNSNDEIVHSQAIKLLELDGGTLEQHFERRLWDFRSHGYEFDRQKCHWHLTPQARSISGTVTYHGELWLKGGPDGCRGGRLVILLTRLMLLKAYLKFSPDFMIGLQAPLSSCRGLGVREGYLRAEQRTISWALKDTDQFEEDWMVWMNREEAEFNLRIPPSFFYEMFEQQAQDALLKKSA